MWAMLNMIMGGGSGQPSLDPYMASLLSNGIMPVLDKNGDPVVEDVETQAKGINAYQDVLSTLSDQANAATSGIGSWGGIGIPGGGVLGGGGLNPITTETVLETPQTQTLQYLSRQQGLEGIIAQKVLSGQTPSMILADLQAKINDPEASGVDPAEAASFAAGLPQKDVLDPLGKPTGQTTVDWEGARKQIDSLAMPYFQEQGMLSGPNITTNAYGQPVSLSEKPSPTMEWFQKQGLTDPRTQYGVDYALQSSPELQTLMGDIASKGQAYEEAQSAYKKFLKEDPQRAALIRQREGLADKRGRATQQAMQDYFGASLRRPTQAIPGGPRPNNDFMVNPDTGGMLEAGDPRIVDNILRFDAATATGGASSDPTLDQLMPGYIDSANAQIRTMTPDPKQLIQTPGSVRAENIRNTAKDQGRRLVGDAPELNLPARSMMERLLGGITAAPFGTSGKLATQAYRAQQAAGDPMVEFARRIAPMYGAMRAGRTPFMDQWEQRMQPLFATGALKR